MKPTSKNGVQGGGMRSPKQTLFLAGLCLLLVLAGYYLHEILASPVRNRQPMSVTLRLTKPNTDQVVASTMAERTQHKTAMNAEVSSTAASQATAPASEASDPESGQEPTMAEPANNNRSELPAICYVIQLAEVPGLDVGPERPLHTSTPGDCCDACFKHTPASADAPACNAWSWCGVSELCGSRYRQCQLKHVVKRQTRVHQGPRIGWISGTAGPDAIQPTWGEPTAEDLRPVRGRSEQPPVQDNRSGRAKPAVEQPLAVKNASTINPVTGKKVRKYHFVSSAGDKVYARWQARVHYYWYLKRKAQCEEELGDACEMGGFTRVLHTGQPDDLMDEIPTFVSDPVPSSYIAHSDYPVLDRPYALVQWLQGADIPEEYVFLTEGDHIFLRPMPNLMGDDDRVLAPFVSYMAPHAPQHAPVVAKFLPSHDPAEAAKVPRTGPSPAFMTMEQMRKVMPIWFSVCVEIFNNPEVSKHFGWIKEMYAFAIAVHAAGAGPVDLIDNLEAHPPFETKLGTGDKPFYLTHFTYGNDFFRNGSLAEAGKGEWRFDKRQYMSKAPPRHLEPPPPAVKSDLLRLLIDSINEATQNIPCWDEYAAKGTRSATCDEVIPGTVYPSPPRNSE